MGEVKRDRGNAANLAPGFLFAARARCRAGAKLSATARLGASSRAGRCRHHVEYDRHGSAVRARDTKLALAGHLRRPGATGTSGCIALPERQVVALQDFARGGAVLAVLPKQALGRFKGCLP